MDLTRSPRRLVIDTDAGSDDAVALMLAGLDPEVRIEAVTVTAGNVPLDQAVKNTLYTLELIGARDVPVYAGRAAPVARRLATAQHVHGDDGMGDVGLPDPTRQVTPGDAVTRIVELARESSGELTLVTLGPLTNVAAALRLDPALLTRFAEVYLMAGAADGVGNVAPVGEFNVWADPEAARDVIAADGEVTIVGWDVSRRFAVMNPSDQQRLVDSGTPFGAFMHAINSSVNEWALTRTGLAGYDLPDPLTMAVALHPELVTRSTRSWVAVATDEPARGMLVVDRRFAPLESNATVVWEVDEASFKDLLFAIAANPTPPGVELPASISEMVVSA